MKVRTPTVVALLVAVAALVAPASPAQASPTDAAFNSTTGALNVNYAGYLSKHDIVYNRPEHQPAARPDRRQRPDRRDGVERRTASRCRSSGVDLSQQSAFAAGLVNLTTTPGDSTRGYTHLPAAAVALRRHADDAVRQQPHRHRHGRAQLRGHGHPRRGHPAGRRSVHARPEPVGPRTRSATSPTCPTSPPGGQRRHVRRRHRRRAQPRSGRPEQLRLHARRHGGGRGLHRPGRQRHPGAAEHHADRRSYTIWFTAAQPDQLAGPQLGAPRPATSSPRSRPPATRTTLTNYKNWWHAFWAQVVRAVLQRRRRRRLPGERLLPRRRT